MNRGVGTLALLALSMSRFGLAPAQAATQISQFGVVISAPGTYNVTQDLTGSGNAITVTAGNVTLHLGGHTLTGRGFGEGIDVEGPDGNSVSIDHGTVQGFQDGIFLNNALNCKISSVTASGNAGVGIFLLNSAGNTVTDNTASQNGEGIAVSGGNGNTVTRNTTYQNFAGITVRDNTSGNTVVHNTATGNQGQGIDLRNYATQNTIQDNTCTGSYVGIDLGSYGFGGTSRNTIQSNTVRFNNQGILIELDYPAASGNTIQGNSATPNANVDLEDDNPGCDSNVWSKNTFVTDLVAGVPDGGPGAGCIR